jgi:hypothetical protein
VTQAGEFSDGSALFFVRWNGSGFERRKVDLPPEFPGHFEQATFAPITLPDLW